MEPEAPFIPELSTEFLEKIIGEKVTSFSISNATVPGDNYMSILFNIEICTERGNTLHTISKCYPVNHMRQSFLNKSNVFWNELCIYKTFIPTLEAFQRGLGLEKPYKLPFPPLVGGEALDFGKGAANDEAVAKLNGKVFAPFDIYIMMVDMKKTRGFRMGNRFLGLDVHEVSLVMAEHSKLHALSWAYKQKNGIQELSKDYPFLDFQFREEDGKMWEGIMKGNCDVASNALEPILGKDSGILKGIEFFKAHLVEVLKDMFDSAVPADQMEQFVRVKVDKDEATRKADNIPWRVVVHGDCWVNNLLFRNDETTKKAVELVLIDLQVMREACPTNDLAYLFYTSTTGEFRKNHLDAMLKLYHDNFVRYCAQFGVDPLPGFSFEALKRRFHRAKLLGFLMALITLPIMLKNAADVPDLDKSSGMGEDFFEMFSNLSSHPGDNRLYQKRMLEVAQGMFADGII